MNSIFTKAWVIDAGERALKAFAGAELAALGSNAVDLNVLQATAGTGLIRSAILGGMSVLLSIVSAPARGISPASIVPPGIGKP